MLLTLATRSFASTINANGQGQGPLTMLDLPDYAIRQLRLRGLNVLAAMLAGWSLQDLDRLRDRADMTQRSAHAFTRRARRLQSLSLTRALWEAGELSNGQVDAIVANLDDRRAPVFAQHETQVVPALVETPSFQSELVLANPTPQALVAQLSYVESLAGTGASGTAINRLIMTAKAPMNPPTKSPNRLFKKPRKIAELILEKS